MKGDQSRLDRRYQHVDLSPREIEAQFQEALARIKAARQHRSQVDGWAQRPGCGGLADYAPLADELPGYDEARRGYVPTGQSVWTKRKDRT